MCTDCTPGYECALGSTNPTPRECDIGGYCNPSRIYTMCASGTYGITAGGTDQASACKACERGYYCPLTGLVASTR